MFVCARVCIRVWHTYPSGSAQFLREKTSWNDQLPRAVDKPLEIPEVACKSDVSKNSLLKFAVQCVKLSIDTDACLLLLDSSVPGLQPENCILVAFHVRQKLCHCWVIFVSTRLQVELDSSFYNIKV